MSSTASSSASSWLCCLNPCIRSPKGRDDEFCLRDAPQPFSWEDIRRATTNFSTLIGEGCFSKVYTALMPSGQPVAVKVSTDYSSERMKTELELAGSVRHLNILKLLGWVSDPIMKKRALVYDYMPNGSLRDHLSGGMSESLEWDVRFRIAKELGAALFHLHHNCDIPIFHRDVKPSHVLLDSQYHVRLAGFGAGIKTSSEEHFSFTIGMVQYVDPEYICTGAVTKNADVYAYGIILLQLVTGKVAHDLMDLIKNISESELPVDAELEGACNDSEVNLLIRLGLHCIRPRSTDRPDMRRVLNILDFLEPLDHCPLSTDFLDYENQSLPLSPAS